MKSRSEKWQHKKRLFNHLRIRDHRSGQALVETAVVLLIMLLLISGLIEFGWAYFRYLAMEDAAGEGAAYGILYPTWQDSSDNPDPNNIAYRVRHESENNLLDWSVTIVEVEAPFLTPGNHITVTVTFEHDLITPILRPLVPDGNITLRARAVQSIISPAPS